MLESKEWVLMDEDDYNRYYINLETGEDLIEHKDND